MADDPRRDALLLANVGTQSSSMRTSSLCGIRSARRRDDPSLVRKARVDDIVATYGHIVVDECHHVPAASFEHVLSEVKARYVVGLTATPQRRDGHHPILAMQLGPTRFSVSTKSRASRPPFTSRLIIREPAFQLEAGMMSGGIQTIYGALATDGDRNARILDDVIRAVHERRSPILLTERREHLEYLADRLRGFVRHLVVLQGGMGMKERRAVVARLAALPEHEERPILATWRYIGEGFDDVSGLVERDPSPVRRVAAPAPREEDGSADLRLRGRERPRPSPHVGSGNSAGVIPEILAG